MALVETYIQSYGQLPEVLKRISEGQAPDKFTRQYLKDLGFAASSFHAVIPMLKALGFLASDGSPTARYHEYRDHSRSRAVLGQALKEAYGDIFTIKANPTQSDRPLIEGKFKSTHNTSERVAQLMANTFYALLALADVNAISTTSKAENKVEPDHAPLEPNKTTTHGTGAISHRPTLHYNIQIHLPATKDIEVFNAIFKSLKEHLLD